ncbi:heptaprenyl diphosphate synthase component 1 [Robertmurraya korlensis]|uniref:heptaprenyl diphosphate synthase component 1 n=1 Tax=Robertmurraya korlensis TaxID=519977 RepID=UPI001E6285BB|nr:heptaprenyl diphosphate synthase component 1 [Robertmurraya korlensis]
MIIVGDFQRKIADVKERIEERLLHPYMFQYINTPVLDEDKLLLLISILDQCKLSNKELENYSITTMLLQVALDTHELVTNTSVNNEVLKRRQLTVLAGVYYSGLYYKLLAECSDVQAIRMLAKAIKTINDKKIIVYQKDISEIDILMNNVKVIESSLINQFSDYFQLDGWPAIVENFLLIKRLSKEKENFIQTKSSIVFDALQTLVFPKHSGSLKELSLEQQNYLILICDRYIEFSKQLLEKAKKGLPRINELLDSRITSIINLKPMAKTFVEEG